MTEREALMILNAVGGITPKRVKTLLSFFGSAVVALCSDKQSLMMVEGITPALAAQIVNFNRNEFLRIENELLEKFNARVVTWDDADYPEALKEFEGAPYVLYIKGNWPENLNLSLAIVGSRNASIYGLGVAEKFGMQLAQWGIPVISGMARGIDTAAHKGVLKAGGQTVAVLGCGLSVVYPPENKNLFEGIAQNGAVISEFPMTMAPISYNFPQRNRIISGLSLGVIVVEASLRSGALITADFALEQGKDVFAVPGKIDSMNSQGVHHLIKQGAKLICSLEDVVEDMYDQIKINQSPNKKEEVESAHFGLTLEEEAILNLIGEEPMHIDEIIEQSTFDRQEVLKIILKLELQKMVQQRPGKFFVNHGQILSHR